MIHDLASCILNPAYSVAEKSMQIETGIKEFMELNEEQEVVLNLDSDIVVEAGAGSGKTRALVARYLHILERGRAGVDGIVAITFTENAAAEMRDRIRHKIKEYIASYGEKNFLNREAIKKLPHARISTIHGFSARVLKENPLESGLIPGFKVIEGIERSVFIEETMNEFIMQLWGSEYESQSRLLLDVLEEEAFDHKRIRQKISEIISIACKLHLEPPWKIFSDGELNVQDECSLLRLLGEKIDGDLKDSRNRYAQNRVASIREARFELIKTGISSSKARLVHEIKESCKGIQELKGASEEEKEIVFNLLQIANHLLDIYDTRLNQIYLPLAEEAYRFLNKKMSDSGFLDYENLLVRARDLLKNNTDLLRYYRKKIKFIMVDEFQDTDSLQYELINLIAEKRGANTFIVGDPVQSIFRFRGGDPTVFNAVKEKESDPKRFAYNYRSEKPLIDFYNNFFSSLLYQSYQTMRAKKDLLPQKNNIEFMFALRSDGSEWRDEEANNIALRIIQLRKEGRNYKDIAVIFRSKKYIYIYENALRGLGVPFSSSSGSGFFGRPEVRDVAVFLKYLLNPKDRIAEACVLRSPFCGASDDELLSYYVHGHEVNKVSKCRELVKKIGNDFLSLTPLKLIERLFEETSYDASVLALPDGKAKHANLTKLINIFGRLELLGYGFEEILDYLDSSSEEDGEPLAQSELEEEDSVKLLTVHKAKGLEFPVVFLADLNHGSGGGREKMLARREGGFLVRYEGVRSQLWEKISELEEMDNREEEKRSLYVAKTRAKELLIVSIGGGKDKEGKVMIKDKQSFAGLLNSVFDFRSDIEAEENLEFAGMKIPTWKYSGSQAPEHFETANEEQFTEIDFQEMRKRFEPIPKPELVKDKDDDDIIQKLGAVNIGALMHRFLEIWDFDEGSIDGHIEFVLNEGFVLDDSLKHGLGKMAQNFLKSELMQKIKSSKRVYREIPFYFLIDERPERGRIDLVLEETAGPALFDYKHVRKEEELPQYKEQIERYARVVEKRFGTAPTEKFFVLLPEVRLVDG